MKMSSEFAQPDKRFREWWRENAIKHGIQLKLTLMPCFYLRISGLCNVWHGRGFADETVHDSIQLSVLQWPNPNTYQQKERFTKELKT